MTLRNESGLAPLGHAVLVKHYQPERKESLIVMPETVSDRNLLVEQRAVVVEVGPNAWKNEPQRAFPGDKVLISKYSGYLARGPLDGQLYAVINDQDIFARITAEAAS